MDLEQGESLIPASQRPDGTWRKARRVKEGYVPQEEVPLYESKGKKLSTRQLTPVEPKKLGGMTGHKTIPGLFIDDKEKEKVPKTKKKTKKVEEITTKIEKLKIIEPVTKIETKPKTEKKESKVKAEKVEAKPAATMATEPAKKLKNLKKRLREVEALEEKIKSGEIANPDKDQLVKIQRKNDLIFQIHELEKSL